MALHLLTLAISITMILASARTKADPSYSVKGSVFCVDCGHSYDYSDIRVLVNCDLMKKPTMAITKKDGSFKAKLPTQTRSLANCQARLLGGPKQLYASKKKMVSKVIRLGDQLANTYTTRTTLTFASACSTLKKLGSCGAQLGSSKTIDLPIPPEYGLPPTSYYAPILPIIGIP